MSDILLVVDRVETSRTFARRMKSTAHEFGREPVFTFRGPFLEKAEVDGATVHLVLQDQPDRIAGMLFDRVYLNPETPKFVADMALSRLVADKKDVPMWLDALLIVQSDIKP